MNIQRIDADEDIVLCNHCGRKYIMSGFNSKTKVTCTGCYKEIRPIELTCYTRYVRRPPKIEVTKNVQTYYTP